VEEEKEEEESQLPLGFASASPLLLRLRLFGVASVSASAPASASPLLLLLLRLPLLPPASPSLAPSPWPSPLCRRKHRRRSNPPLTFRGRPELEARTSVSLSLNSRLNFLGPHHDELDLEQELMIFASSSKAGWHRNPVADSAAEGTPASSPPRHLSRAVGIKRSCCLYYYPGSDRLNAPTGDLQYCC
jgi:hypothetical protein